MKRPRGVTSIALLAVFLGVVWLLIAVPQFVELLKDVSKPDPWGAKWRGLFAAWSLLWATFFLSAARGLWRLREWARIMTAALAVLISAALLVDFSRWPAVSRDYIDQWDHFLIASRYAMLAPYYLGSWPVWESMTNFFPEFPYLGQEIGGYFFGGLGYAAIARYMLSDRVKQAFSAAF